MAAVRVLQVIPTLSRSGGVAQMMWRVYRALDKQHIQFDFLAHEQPDDLQDDVHSLGARTYHIGTLGQLGPRSYLNTLRRIISEEGPFAAVHVHTNYQAGIVGLAARLEQVKRRIGHIQGTKISAKNRAMLPAYRLMIRLGCNIRLACNQEAGQFYYGSQTFSIIPNAIDFEEFRYDDSKATQIRDDLNINSYEVALGHVGRFTDEKNHLFSIDVLEGLRRMGTKACLLLVGEGPLRREIEKRAQTKGLSDHIRFLGIRNDISSLMSTFNALLLPSLSEGQPTVLVEAQAAGLPCLASDIVTRRVDFGLGLVSYIPLSSPAVWARSVKALGGQPRLPPGLIREALLRTGFDVVQSAQNLTALYDATPEC